MRYAPVFLFLFFLASDHFWETGWTIDTWPNRTELGDIGKDWKLKLKEKKKNKIKAKEIFLLRVCFALAIDWCHRKVISMVGGPLQHADASKALNIVNTTMQITCILSVCFFLSICLPLCVRVSVCGWSHSATEKKEKKSGFGSHSRLTDSQAKLQQSNSNIKAKRSRGLFRLPFFPFYLFIFFFSFSISLSILFSFCYRVPLYNI